MRRFAEGLDEILVVEEKRQLLEYQLKEELYNWRAGRPPQVIGKFDERASGPRPRQPDGHLQHGDWLLNAAGELPVATIARPSRSASAASSPRRPSKTVCGSSKPRSRRATPVLLAERNPISVPAALTTPPTVVPEGSRAVAGIGCHYMATWMDRRTATFTHMGGEGVPWVGQAPFTSENAHVFANLGDGTYFHSGLLAIRQAIRFKARGAAENAGPDPRHHLQDLYNDAVAMTGGQADGRPTVGGAADAPVGGRRRGNHGHRHRRPEIRPSPTSPRRARSTTATTSTASSANCGAARRLGPHLRPDLRHREAPAAPRQNEPGGDAAGLHQRRRCAKAAATARPNQLPRRGAGGNRIRAQAGDRPVGLQPGFLLPEGLLPQFRHRRRRGTAPRQGPLKPATPPAAAARSAAFLATATPYNLLITGVGGMGVITLGALVGMAAHLDGKGVSVLDMTGLAQKYGAVYSHLRFADRPEDIRRPHRHRRSPRRPGGDLVVSAGPEALAKMLEGRTRAVFSRTETPTADFTQPRTGSFPRRPWKNASATRSARATPISSTPSTSPPASWAMPCSQHAPPRLRLAKGLVPVSRQALDRAIELNGAAVEANRQAFAWGRRAAAHPDAVARLAARPRRRSGRTQPRRTHRPAGDHLTAYQDAAWPGATGSAWNPSWPGRQRPLLAVARNYAKLLAIRDEYEVARLYSQPEFREKLAATFAGDFRLSFHLAPRD